MKQYIEIVDIFGREVMDSRGNPTVEVEVHTECASGRAIVPSGASTGVFEAVELRDNDKKRYGGKGVKNAVANVNEKIADVLIGMNVLDQRSIDMKMCELDNKSNLGANAILGVSLAVARAAAASLEIPLFQYIGGINSYVLPVPMMNILNGGAHANNNVDIQEFMIMPYGAKSFKQGLRWCSEVFHELKKVLSEMGNTTAVGDEGGFAPNLETDEKALEVIMSAIGRAGYKAGEDFKIAIDAASSEWVQDDGTYLLPKSGIKKTASELVEYWQTLCEKYPIFSIEDALGEDDWDGWKILTDKLGDKIQSIHLNKVNLRINKKFRESLEPLQLERIESPYRTNNDSNEERCRTLLIQHLDKHGCITRTDFMRLAEISRNKAIELLNKFLEEEIIRKYGGGKTVVYLKK